MVRVTPCRMNMDRVRVASCLVCCRELRIDELMDVALGTNDAQDFDLNIHLHLVGVDDVAPPTIRLCDAKRHASLLSSFLVENTLYFGVNEIISSHRSVRNSYKMTNANLGMQHQRSMDSYFKSS